MHFFRGVRAYFESPRALEYHPRAFRARARSENLARAPVRYFLERARS
eukprot:UN25081